MYGVIGAGRKLHAPQAQQQVGITRVSSMKRWSPTHLGGVSDSVVDEKWDGEVGEFLKSCLGSDRLERITHALSTPACHLCIRVNRLKTTREEVIRRLPLELEDEDDKKLLQEFPPEAHDVLPMAVILRGKGPCEVEYDDSLLEGREVIVGRLAGEAMLKGAHCYAPGILASTHGLQKGDLVAVSVGLETSKDTFGVSRLSLLPPHIPLDDARFPNRQNLFIGIGMIMCDRGDMVKKQGLAVKMVQRVYTLPSIDSRELMNGEIIVQALPSLVAAATLNPSPGSRVIDMCAAPGGKTTALAEIMENRGEIFALDRTHAKAKRIQDLADKMGIKIIKALKADATKAVSKREGEDYVITNGELRLEKGSLKRDQRKQERRILAGHPEKHTKFMNVLENGFREKSFDYVLLDAPCTALGLRPRLLLSNMSMEDLKKTAAYQRMLLDAAVKLVRPGGCVVFSTCSISPLENEANVRYVLDTYPFMELGKSDVHLGGPGLTGTVTLPNRDGNNRECHLLTEEEAKLVQRFDPGGELDTMGFFVAKFKRTAAE